MSFLICRACLTKSESYTYSLFVNVDASVFEFCTSVGVSEEDALPKALCDVCYEKLFSFKEFKHQCINANDKLLSQYGNLVEVEVDVSNDDYNNIDNESDTDHCIKEFDVSASESKASIKFRPSKDIKKDCLETSENNFVEIKEKYDTNFTHGRSTHEVQKQQDYTNIDTENTKGNKKIKSKRIKRLRNSQRFDCSICNKVFNLEEKLDAHKLTDHEGKPAPEIKCKLCSKPTKSWRGLVIHRAVRHSTPDTGQVPCPDCNKLHHTEASLAKHRRRRSTCAPGQSRGAKASSKKPEVCHVCGKILKSAYNLKMHLLTHEGSRERESACAWCGARFHSAAAARAHLRRRHTGRRHACAHPACTRHYADLASLRRHQLAHLGVKPHQCNICLKRYSNSGHLAEHRRSHTGERPFPCPYCPKAFPSKKRMVEHSRTHTGEKPHKCDQCEQAFIQRGTLVRHMKVHNKYLKDKKSKVPAVDGQNFAEM